MSKHQINPNPASLPAWSAEQLRAKVRQYDRTPFLDLLAQWIECAPTVERVVEFADAHPDRYIKALSALGALAGFTEKREVSWSGRLDVGSMSDSQLEDNIAEIAQRLGLPMPKTIEHK